MVRNMQRILYTLALVFFLSVSLFGEHNSGTTLRVGVYHNPPMVFLDQGSPRGLAVEILEGVAEGYHWNIEYVAGTWSETWDRLRAGTIDVAVPVAWSEERLHMVLFSRESLLSSWAQVYCRDNETVATFLDIDGLTMAVSRRDVHYTGPAGMLHLVKQFNLTVQFLETGTYRDVYRAIEEGHADCGVVSRLYGEYAGAPGNAYRSAIVFNPVKVHFAFRMDMDRLTVEHFDRELARMKLREGSLYYNAIEKWLHSTPSEGLNHWLFYAIVVLLILFFLIVAGALFFKHQVDERTAELKIKNDVLVSEMHQRRKLEENIRRDEEWLRALVNAFPDPVFIIDIDGNYRDVFVSPVNASPGITELKGKNILDVYGAEGERYIELIRDVIERRYLRVIHYRLPDNPDRYLEGRIAPVLNEDGFSNRVVWVRRDITSRHCYEQQLHDEKERLSVILSSIADGVIATDYEGKVLFMNPVAQDLTGWPVEEAQGKPISNVMEIHDSAYQTPLDNPVEVLLSTGSFEGRSGYTILRDRDGSQRYVSEKASLLQDTTTRTRGAVLVLRDMTARVTMEDELMRIRKLESLGLLAGGIAHDFNNILTAVLGNLSLMGVTPDIPKNISTSIQETEKAVLRARDLTSQLLTFSRGGAPVKKLTALSHLVIDTVKFALSGSNIHSRFEIYDELWPLEIDAGQISQVINNLVLNAKEAMEQGGTVTVTMTNRRMERGTPLPLEPGNYVELVVSDEGGGIPEELKEAVFDPYFTTKEKGNGLGLATSYSIIHRHGGHITFRDNDVGGTSFYIYLPALNYMTEKSLIEKSEPESKETDSCGDLKVLLMDDDSMVRNVAARIFAHLGCRYEIVDEGESALSVYRDAMEEDPFHVVIMDLTIPGGMGGREAVAALLEIDPSALVIVASGYSNDPVLSEYRSYGFSGYLVKPFTIEEMRRVIKELIKKM